MGARVCEKTNSETFSRHNATPLGHCSACGPTRSACGPGHASRPVRAPLRHRLRIVSIMMCLRSSRLEVPKGDIHACSHYDEERGQAGAFGAHDERAAVVVADRATGANHAHGAPANTV